MRNFGLFVLLFISVCSASIAQYSKPFGISDTTNEKQDRITTNVTAGTSVATNFDGGAAFSTFIAPTLNYRFTPKWSVSFGTSIVNTQLDNWTNYNMEESSSRHTSYTQQILFVQLNYEATENLTLNGAIYHNMWSSPDFAGSANRYNMNGNAYSFGLDYQFSNGFAVGLQVSHSQGYQPFNSFYSPGLSPFNNTPGRFGGYGFR